MVNTLKRALIDAGVRQYHIAQKAGCTETRLSRLATGRATATEEERRHLAEVLGVPERELFDEPSTTPVARPASGKREAPVPTERVVSDLRLREGEK